MRRLVSNCLFITFLIAFLFTSSRLVHAQSYTLSCHVEFLGSTPSSPPLTLEESLNINSLLLGDNPSIRVNFDDLILSFSILWIPDTKSQITPALQMNLFQGANPITGKINGVQLEGLDFSTIPTGTPLMLKGIQFLDVSVNNHAYSRINYSCSITRLTCEKALGKKTSPSNK